jgi:hypothetical protein
MGTNPIQGIVSTAGFKTETVPGTKIALTGSEFLDLMSEESSYEPVHYRGESIIGNRQEQGDLEVVSHNDGRTTLKCRPRGLYMEELLALIFGVDTVGVHTPILGNDTDLATFTCEVDKAGLNNLRLIGCKVGKATFESQANQPLMLTLEAIAMSGERDVGDLATPTYTWLTDGMFMHGDMTMDATGHAFLGGATGLPVRSIQFECDNDLDDSEAGFTNSTDRKIIPVGMFNLTGNIVVPYNSTTKDLIASLVAAEKVGWGIVYTTGTPGHSLLLDFVTKFEGDMPDITDNSNQWITMNFHGVVDAASTNSISAELITLS